MRVDLAFEPKVVATGARARVAHAASSDFVELDPGETWKIWMKLLLSSLAVSGLACTAAQAATIDSDSFFAPGDVKIDFDGLTAGTSFIALSGVRFSAEPDGNRGSAATDPGDATGRFADPFQAYAAAPGGGTPSSAPIYVAGDYLPTAMDAADMRFDFLGGALAFGMQLIDNDFSVGRLTAFAMDGSLIDSVTIPQVSEGGSAFWGIDGAGSVISYAILDGDGGSALDSTFIDDFHYRPVAPVPLPATGLLLAAGLASLALRRKRG